MACPLSPLLPPIPSTHQTLCFGLRGSAVCSLLPPSALCQSPGGLGRGSSCQVGPPGWGYKCPHLGKVCPYGSMVTVFLLSSFLSCSWQQCPINSSRCWKLPAQCCLRQRVNLGGENWSANSHAFALSSPFRSPRPSVSLQLCLSQPLLTLSSLCLPSPPSTPWRQEDTSLRVA